MRPSTTSRSSLALAALFAALPIVAQAQTLNQYTPAQVTAGAPGAEVARGGSTLPSTGTFAGGSSRVFAPGSNDNPLGWDYAAAQNGRPDQWIYDTTSPRAKEGNGYIYVSSVGNYNLNNDDCIQGRFDNLTVGRTYGISFWAADAGSYSVIQGNVSTGRTTAITGQPIGTGGISTPVEPVANNTGAMLNRTRINGNLVFELATGGSTVNQADSFNQTVVAPLNGVWAFNRTLTSNAAWSDTTDTAIPWVQVDYRFVATATTMTFWLSANNPTTTGTAFTNATATNIYSTVFDAVSVVLIPVPEPSTYGLMGCAALAGMIGYRRFRNRAKTIAK
jgi:PEP-CTERM motif